MTEADKARLAETQERDSQEDRFEINAVNQAFYLVEAGVFLMSEAGKMFRKRHSDVRQDVKKKFNDIDRAIKRLEFLCEDLSPFYGESFEERVGSAYEEIQTAANWYGRFALLAGDRLNIPEKEEKLMSYIKKFKSHGMITDEKLESLKLK